MTAIDAYHAVRPEHQTAAAFAIRGALIRRVLALFPIRSYLVREVSKLLRDRLKVRIDGDTFELVTTEGQPAEPWIADQLRQPEYRRFLTRPLRAKD